MLDKHTMSSSQLLDLLHGLIFCVFRDRSLWQSLPHACIYHNGKVSRVEDDASWESQRVDNTRHYIGSSLCF